MAKKRRVEEDIVSVFDNWAISPKAKENLARKLLEESPSSEPPVSTSDVSEMPLTDTSTEKGEDIEGEGLPTARPAIAAPQSSTLKSRPSSFRGPVTKAKPIAAEVSSLKRQFTNRPQVVQDASALSLVENIPKRYFFSYYNALHDKILLQVPKKSRLLLCVLFRRSYGFNRNWCRVSYPELERATGATANTLRDCMRELIEGGWVAIVSDGFHEVTTYLVNISADLPGEPDGEEGDPDSETPKFRPSTSDTQNLRLQSTPGNVTGDNPRASGGAPDPQQLRLKKSASDPDTQNPSRPAAVSEPQKMRASTSSTYTGFSTVQQPAFHHSEVGPSTISAPIRTTSGENQVKGNLALKPFLARSQTQPETNAAAQGAISEMDEAYIRSQPSSHQVDLFEAQDAWDEILGPQNRPAASKLGEMLGYIRDRGYSGDILKGKFRGCLEKTKGRAKDPVGWIVSALKAGRYP